MSSFTEILSNHWSLTTRDRTPLLPHADAVYARLSLTEFEEEESRNDRRPTVQLNALDQDSTQTRMSKALLSDLNFGHLGKPVYDSESREWRFARRPSTARRLKPVGQPIIALEGSAKILFENNQNASDRSRTIKDLIQAHPELAPAAFLLSDLAQTSEAVNEVTAGHDPTVSELLAFGEAVDITRGRGRLRKIPIVAVTAGAAGELVKLVRLTPAQLVWDDSGDAHLNCMTARGGEEGFWMGNGSRVQQLVFAEAEGKASHWLAVRYHGAISILRPLLLPDTDIAASHDGGTLPPSRLDANHTLTLAEQNGVPFSDLCFNPWNNEQFATIDQEGCWTIWDIEVPVNPKEKGHGTVIQRSQGHITDGHKEGPASSSPIADGWNRVLWVGAKDSVAVASRRSLTVFDIGNPLKMLYVIDIDRGKEGDWLLDIKQCSLDASSMFVVTSSRILWIRAPSADDYYKSNEVKPGASILLSWDHFRDREDISLRLNIIGVFDSTGPDNDATSNSSRQSTQDRDALTFLVLLYSRLSGLIMNFTFHHRMFSSEQALSAVDPYIFKMDMDDSGLPGSGAVAYNPYTGPQISDIVIKALRHDRRHPSVQLGKNQNELENLTVFYQLSVLSHDSTLSEVLCAEVEAVSTVPIPSPNLIVRKFPSKSSAIVFDGFIMPNKFRHQQHHYTPKHGLGEPIHQPSSERSATETPSPDEYQSALSLEWLQMAVHSALAAPSPDIDEVLEYLYVKFKERLELEDAHLGTLSSIANTGISVVDIDKAAAGFADFLGDIAGIASGEDKNANDEGKRLHISSVLTQSMMTTLGLREPFQLSNVYNSIIKTWIAPLPSSIPGRTRIALEKVLRDIVMHISLSSYNVRMSQEPTVDKQGAHGDRIDSRPPFVLPVRRRVSVTNLEKNKEPVATSSSALGSSQASQGDPSLRPSPPAQLMSKSMQSQRKGGPASSQVESEDIASLRLKALASLKPQPALPTKMSNLLKQWDLGADPAAYDWEAAQQAFNTEEESEDEARKKQRQRVEKRRMQQRTDMTIPSSQPPPKKVGGSQPQSAHETQGSSQQTQDMVIQSQVEPGRFGGRSDQAKRPKRKRGF